MLKRQVTAEQGGRRVTSDNVAPLIQILAWLFLAFGVLSAGVQFSIKRALSRRFAGADVVLFIALAFFVGQTAILLSPGAQAIGKTQTPLSADTIDGALKALYSWDMVNILTLVATKESLLLSLWALSPVAHHRKIVHVATAVTAVWGISAIFIVALQCPAPERWNVQNPKCIDMRAAKIYTVVLNILTDVGLLIIPTLMILPLQMNLRKRIAILSGFWFRLTVILASIVQIVYIQRLKFNGDFLNDVWPTVVSTQVMLTTSLMTACIPFLKPFLMSLETGFVDAAIDPHRKTTSANASAGKSGRDTSTYIKIGSQQSRDPSMKRERDIWVRQDFTIKRESAVELQELSRSEHSLSKEEDERRLHTPATTK